MQGTRIVGGMVSFRQCALLLVWITVPHLLSCQDQQRTSGHPAELGEQVALKKLIGDRSIDPRTIDLYMDKSERVLQVRSGGVTLKAYPCVLGLAPVGDKLHEGDRRTPEGIFTFRSKRVHDRWHKFIWVDHPNTESWRRFRARQAEGIIPPGRGIGGEIGIHGVPEGMDHWIDQGVDWTWGCIALRNADVDEIYPYIIPGHTEITIVP